MKKVRQLENIIMNDIWLISDTHFGHKNILNFIDFNGNLIRGNKFSSAEEMDDCMFDNWNETVKPKDEVYHLGDLTWNNNSTFADKFKTLNGKKKLIVGNHDNIKWIVKNELFKEVVMLRLLREHNLLLTHVPIDISGLRSYSKDGIYRSHINVHGHIHQNFSPTKHHRCVCVEWTDYKPIHIDKVLQLNNFMM